MLTKYITFLYFYVNSGFPKFIYKFLYIAWNFSVLKNSKNYLVTLKIQFTLKTPSTRQIYALLVFYKSFHIQTAAVYYQNFTFSHFKQADQGGGVRVRVLVRRRVGPDRLQLQPVPTHVHLSRGRHLQREGRLQVRDLPVRVRVHRALLYRVRRRT